MACYHTWRESRRSGQSLLVVDFTLEQYWLEGRPALELAALYCVKGGNLRVSVTEQALVADGCAGIEQYQRWVTRHGLVDVDPGDALSLAPETMPKPWGQELWYTAVEHRRVCSFVHGQARVPIPWLQAVLPAATAGSPGQPPLLLKILRPAPEPVLGDLYFELHERKRELYVVTGIDRRAWPDGVGYMRFGFNQQRLDAYATEDEFRSAYLAAVQAYEQLRSTLDALPPGSQPDLAQRSRESALRREMDRFTALRPLRVGDVVEVPPMLPHSLLHGVKVIEFQTPAYERKILSFAQKVLTQDHWDTSAVIARMQLRPPEPGLIKLEREGEGVVVERLARLPDFEVSRVSIAPGQSWQPDTLHSYCVVIVVSGRLHLAGADCRAEEAVLLPRCWGGKLASREGSRPLLLLLAAPRR